MNSIKQAIIDIVNNMPVPVSHTLLAIAMFLPFAYVNQPIAGAAFASAWAMSREVRDWQKGTGYGLQAWLYPTLVSCALAAIWVLIGA
jgi:hypothetical protein